MIRFTLALFLSFIFIGCISTPEPVAYPSWYLNPPQNNGSFLYGVGEGSDLNSAKASALSSVSASLSITVSSELKKSESSSSLNGNENSYKSVVNRVNAEVKAIEFNDYKVTKNQVINSKFLILIEVSRHKLFNEQKTKLDNYLNELKNEQQEIQKYTAIKQALLYSHNEEKTAKLKSLALLTKTVNSNFDTAPYLKEISEIKASKQDALSRVKVSVKASKEASLFLDALKEGLNKAGITTVKQGANTYIKLNNHFQTDEIYGYKIAKSSLTISTQSLDKTLATNTLALSGKSRYDYQKAKENTAKVLRAKIKKEGIFSILGLK